MDVVLAFGGKDGELLPGNGHAHAVFWSGGTAGAHNAGQIACNTLFRIVCHIFGLFQLVFVRRAHSAFIY